MLRFETSFLANRYSQRSLGKNRCPYILLTTCAFALVLHPILLRNIGSGEGTETRKKLGSQATIPHRREVSDSSFNGLHNKTNLTSGYSKRKRALEHKSVSSFLKESEKDPIICTFFAGFPKVEHEKQLRYMYGSARLVHPSSELVLISPDNIEESAKRIHRDVQLIVWRDLLIGAGLGNFTIQRLGDDGYSSLKRGSMKLRLYFEKIYMLYLKRRHAHSDIIFADSDILFLRSTQELFRESFAVALTFRKPQGGSHRPQFIPTQEPINLGVKFVHAAKLDAAIALWSYTLHVYENSRYAACYDCDQLAFSDAVHIKATDKVLEGKSPFSRNVHTRDGPVNVYFVHCTVYNSYPHASCRPSAISSILHLKGNLKRWMEVLYHNLTVIHQLRNGIELRNGTQSAAPSQTSVSHIAEMYEHLHNARVKWKNSLRRKPT